MRGSRRGACSPATASAWRWRASAGRRCSSSPTTRSSPTPVGWPCGCRPMPGTSSAWTSAGLAGVHVLHDADLVRVRCDLPLPLEADGEDLGDVTEAVFEAERDAITIL